MFTQRGPLNAAPAVYQALSGVEAHIQCSGLEALLIHLVMMRASVRAA